MKITSHAYIFLGSDETTTQKALTLAQNANCKNPDMAPCGFCSMCRKTLNNTHPDVVQVFPDGTSLKIGQVRKLILNLAEKPVEGDKKICILHEAHLMTPQAQNALLKTLEEPIAESIIILLSDNLKKIIPTVVSRCQVQDFSETVTKSPISPDVRRKIIEILFNTTQKNSYSNFGIYVKELSDMDERAEDLLEYIISVYRDTLLVKTNSSSALINQDIKPEITHYASVMSIYSIVCALDLAYMQLKAIKSRGNKNLVWYNLLIGLEEVS